MSTEPTTPSRRLISVHRPKITAALAIIAAATAIGAGTAGAHVEPSITEVPARSYATVDFTVEHGCESSPTIKLEFQIPEELDDAVPVAKDGWTTSVVDRVATFEGGPLPADQPDTFSVSFTVPPTQGTVLTFPFIQTCEEGSIDWIQTTVDAERPAPVVRVGAPDPSAPTAPATSAPTTTAAPTPTSEPPATTATTEASPTTELPAEPTEGSADDDTGGNPWLPVVGGVILTAAIVGGVIVQRNRSRSQ